MIFQSFQIYSNKSKVEIDSTKIVQGLKYILPSVDTNNPKFQLNGALIDISQG